MKKAKKKMNIGKKLLAIIGILIACMLMIFWREVYTIIAYADICNKYLFWQDYVEQIGGEYVVREGKLNDTVHYYFSKNKVIINDSRITLNSDYTYAYELNSEIPGTFVRYSQTEDYESKNIAKTYIPKEFYPNQIAYGPDTFVFNYEQKVTFWHLMSKIGRVRYIRVEEINGLKYYVMELTFGASVYINKETGLMTRYDAHGGESLDYIIQFNKLTDSQKDFPPEDAHYILFDYSTDEYLNPDKVYEKTDVKISNCDKEAGTIVDYSFKVKNNETDSLQYFEPLENDNLMMLEIKNYITYKEVKSRWSELRDLTEKDFENYYVIIIIDKDNKKEINFESLTENPERIQVPSHILKLKEEKASEDYKYSGSLIIIPNSIRKNYETHNSDASYDIVVE